jgi:dTDP-3-amino-3,4,6-trideoxy-alpha-D-glucose transaminase
VIAVHLFGNVAPVAEIEALGVPVLEDSAQAAGSTSDRGRPGSLGTAATFSFFPSKNLGCFGDGGMITTREDEVAERVRMLRFHGSRDKVSFEQVGYNSRLDEIQAAILRVQLPHLDRMAEGRRQAGRDYEQAGLGELVALPRASEGSQPAWHLYMVAHEEADQLQSSLQSAGIEARPYYRTPVHRQPAMAHWGEGLDLPATDRAAARNLAIPISPVLTREQVEEVVSAVRSHQP